MLLNLLTLAESLQTENNLPRTFKHGFAYFKNSLTKSSSLTPSASAL